tara:strand:- start:145 stop:339 length:195 start_codon:yes stop_codon:yes gene_type:complete
VSFLSKSSVYGLSLEAGFKGMLAKDFLISGSVSEDLKKEGGLQEMMTFYSSRSVFFGGFLTSYF